MDFRNRITGEALVKPATLKANPKNWRVHSSEQREALAGVLKEVGWVQRVIVNRTTGHVLDGHLRVDLALERREKTIPVVYVDLSPAEEDLVLATIDPIGGLAAMDANKLAALLAEIDRPEDDALAQLLADLGELTVLPEEGEGEPPEQTESSKRRAFVILCDSEADLRRVRGALRVGKSKGKAGAKGVDLEDLKVEGAITAGDFLGLSAGGDE